MNQIRRKVFVGPTIYWGFKCLNYYRDKIRDEAEAFINEMGMDRLISVNEHVTSNGPFSVVVWYRVEEGAGLSETFQMTNGMLRRGREVAMKQVEAGNVAASGDRGHAKGRWS